MVEGGFHEDDPEGRTTTRRISATHLTQRTRPRDYKLQQQQFRYLTTTFEGNHPPRQPHKHTHTRRQQYKTTHNSRNLDYKGETVPASKKVPPKRLLPGLSVSWQGLTLSSLHLGQQDQELTPIRWTSFDTDIQRAVAHSSLSSSSSLLHLTSRVPFFLFFLLFIFCALESRSTLELCSYITPKSFSFI